MVAPSAYDMSLRSAITGQDLPPSTLLLDAKGNEEQINLTRLRLSALQGNADITGWWLTGVKQSVGMRC